MGLDGGTYVSRSDVLRRQSWQVAQADTSRSTRGGAVVGTPSSAASQRQQETRIAAWSTCALSGEPLREPLVADYLGALYNKAAVLELLLCQREVWVEGQASLYRHLNRQLQTGECFSHLKSLKDVFPVVLVQAGGTAQESGSCAGVAAAKVQQAGSSSSPSCGFVCPVTGLPLGLSTKAVALVKCGHVLAERAVAAVGGSDCPVCGEHADPVWGVVVVNGAAADVASLRGQLDGRRRRHRKREGQHRAPGGDADSAGKRLRLVDHAGTGEPP